MISPNFPRKNPPILRQFPSAELISVPSPRWLAAVAPHECVWQKATVGTSWNLEPGPGFNSFLHREILSRWLMSVSWCWLVGWLAGWVVGWLVGWLIDWFVGWLIDWFDWLCLPCDVFNLSGAIHVNVQWYANPPGWLLMSPVQMIVSQIIIQLTAVCIPIVKNPLLVSHIPLLGGVSFQQKHFWGWATFSQKINLQQKFNTS